MESDIKLGYNNENGIFEKDYVVIEGECVIIQGNAVIQKSLRVPEITNDVYFAGLVEVGGQVKAGMLNVEENIQTGKDISCGGDAEISGKLTIGEMSDESGLAITIDRDRILVEKRYLILIEPGKAKVEYEVLDLVKEVIQLRKDVKEIQKKLGIS